MFAPDRSYLSFGGSGSRAVSAGYRPTRLLMNVLMLVLCACRCCPSASRSVLEAEPPADLLAGDARPRTTCGAYVRTCLPPSRRAASKLQRASLTGVNATSAAPDRTASRTFDLVRRGSCLPPPRSPLVFDSIGRASLDSGVRVSAPHSHGSRTDERSSRCKCATWPCQVSRQGTTSERKQLHAATPEPPSATDRFDSCRDCGHSYDSDRRYHCSDNQSWPHRNYPRHLLGKRQA